jgi:dTDP-4-amino-4,6-dideoxygalactose transaminase
MQERGIPCSTISRRIDRHPVFGGQRTDLPGVDYFDAHQINIPCHDGLSDTDVEQVIESIKKGW